MQKLNLLLIRYPILNIVIMLSIFSIIRLSIIENMATCESIVPLVENQVLVKDEEKKEESISWKWILGIIGIVGIVAATAYKYGWFNFSVSAGADTFVPRPTEVANPLSVRISSPADMDKLKDHWELIETAYGHAIVDLETARRYNPNVIYNITTDKFMTSYANLGDYPDNYIGTYRLAIEHLFQILHFKQYTVDDQVEILYLTFHSTTPDIVQYRGYDYTSSLELLEYTNYHFIILSLLVIMLLFLAYIIIKNNMVTLKNNVITARKLVYEYVISNPLKVVILLVILVLITYLIYILTISLLVLGFLINLIINYISLS